MEAEPGSAGRCRLTLLAALVAALLIAPDARADALDRVRHTGILLYGSDAEGGGPYAFPDPANPARMIGFEVELMDLLAGTLGPTPTRVQAQWDTLLQVLGTGHVDAVVNGYEWTPAHASRYLATRPYYVNQLQVMARRGGPVGSWGVLAAPKPGGGRWKVGVLGGSAAETFAREGGGRNVEVLYFNGAVDGMMATRNGQVDATLQDLPAARYYGGQYPELTLAGPPVGRSLYVMYLRPEDARLRDALDRGINRLVASGELRRLYEKYRIWTDAQAELSTLGPTAPPAFEASRRSLLRRYGPSLLAPALMTVFLSCASMPLAMALGLAVALGRMYGPTPVRWSLGVYVEVLRGTPLMLQLFALFFLLPELHLSLPPLVAGVVGLAVNYSAYEAEVYRAGLQAIPDGQMEAALALGMSRGLALRRVIVPQAARVVLPAVTNDFINLFKDTSVCSVITLVELTKQYSILANSTGGVVEFALATSALYLLMSLPLAWASRWSERRLATGGARP